MGHSTNLLLIRSGFSYKWSLFFISSHLFSYYNDINSFFYKSIFYLYFLFKYKYFKIFLKKGFLFSHLNFCLIHNENYVFNVFLYDKNFFKLKKKFFKIFKFKLRHIYNKKKKKRRRFFRFLFKQKPPFVVMDTNLKKFFGYRIYALNREKNIENVKKVFLNLFFLKYFSLNKNFLFKNVSKIGVTRKKKNLNKVKFLKFKRSLKKRKLNNVKVLKKLTLKHKLLLKKKKLLINDIVYLKNYYNSLKLKNNKFFQKILFLLKFLREIKFSLEEETEDDLAYPEGEYIKCVSVSFVIKQLKLLLHILTFIRKFLGNQPVMNAENLVFDFNENNEFPFHFKNDVKTLIETKKILNLIRQNSLELDRLKKLNILNNLYNYVSVEISVDSVKLFIRNVKLFIKINFNLKPKKIKKKLQVRKKQLKKIQLKIIRLKKIIQLKRIQLKKIIKLKRMPLKKIMELKRILLKRSQLKNNKFRINLDFLKIKSSNSTFFSSRFLNFNLFFINHLNFLSYNSFKLDWSYRLVLQKFYNSFYNYSYFFRKKAYKQKYKINYYIKKLYFQKLYSIFLFSFFSYNKVTKKINFNIRFFFYLVYLFFFFIIKKYEFFNIKKKFNIFFFFYKKKKKYFDLKNFIFKRILKILKKTKRKKINRFSFFFFYLYFFFVKIVNSKKLKLFMKFIKFFYKLFSFWFFFKFIKKKLLFFYKNFFYKKLIKFFVFKLNFFLYKKKFNLKKPNFINLKFNILSRIHLSGQLFLLYWKWKLHKKYTVNKIIWPFLKRRLKSNIFLKGFNFIISGRFIKRQRALTSKIRLGRLSYKTIFVPVYFFSKTVITRYGTCNFKLTLRYNKRFFFRNLNNYFLVNIF